MSASEHLKSTLARHKESLDALEREIDSVSAGGLVAQNALLEAELAACRSDLEVEKALGEKYAKENKNLKSALYEQLLSEKTAALKSAGKKINQYYIARVSGEKNRLAEFERTALSRIDYMEETLRQNRVAAEDDIYGKLNFLRGSVSQRVAERIDELDRQAGSFAQSCSAQFQQLKEEKVTEEEIQGKVKRNNMERLVGLNIINVLGVFLLIVGVIAASQLPMFQLSDGMKCILSFIAGGALLILGEMMNRKHANVFSLGITSGGIAILYVALVLSYFGFNMLSMFPALGICVGITTVAFILSRRYHSQTIAAFAMVGGYLPLLSMQGNKPLVYGAMVYFVILNTLALTVAVNRKWRIASFIGFALNTAGSFYIMLLMFGHGLSQTRLDDIVTILYLFFAFVIYTLIPLLSTWDKELRFKPADVVLLALNTFISSVLLYTAFYTANLLDYTGLFALTMAAVYLGLGRFVEIKLDRESSVRTLFYLTGLTFLILIIPFQFDYMWLSLGWLVEGVCLLVFGALKGNKRFKLSGAIIGICCTFAFLLYDLPNFNEPLFVYKYSAFTVGSLVVLIALAVGKSLKNPQENLFKYMATLNFWAYLLYLINDRFARFVLVPKNVLGLDQLYVTGTLTVVAGFLVSYFIVRIRPLRDGGIRLISGGIYIVSILYLFFINAHPPESAWSGAGLPGISGTALLIMLSLLSVIAFKDLIFFLVLEKKLGVEWYPLSVACYFLLLLTQNMIVRFSMAWTNATISIVYVIAALLLILLGFAKRYTLIRVFGLALSMLAVAKLFLLDLAFLSKGYRILSYFAFGFTLLAISFVYQYFNKRIEGKVDALAVEKVGLAREVSKEKEE